MVINVIRLIHWLGEQALKDCTGFSWLEFVERSQVSVQPGASSNSSRKARVVEKVENLYEFEILFAHSFQRRVHAIRRVAVLD